MSYNAIERSIEISPVELFKFYDTDGTIKTYNSGVEDITYLSEVYKPEKIDSDAIELTDETDSGLDVDALKLVGKTINHLKEKNNMSVLLITHYTRILKYIHADKVYIMQDGHILRSGDASLAHELEEKGFK
jgi:Fe-S cluster assembly ATPase SufC